MWFWYSLASAFVSGISVVYNKRVLNKGVHSSVVSLFLFGFCTIAGAILLLANNQGETNKYFFIAAAVSAVTFAFSKTTQLNIFKQNNLSDIYPLASLSPLLLYLVSVVSLKEEVKYTGFFGILLMVVGVYLINFKSDNKDILHPIKNLVKNKFALMYLFAIFISNISAVAEKVAINNILTSNIYYLAFWENLFLTAIIGGRCKNKQYLAKRDKRSLLASGCSRFTFHNFIHIGYIRF